MIHAEIIGDNTARVGEVVAKSSAPVLALCRKLIEAGFDPAEPLDAYRGDVLCLSVRSIGDGAKLVILENANRGPERRKWRPSAYGDV